MAEPHAAAKGDGAGGIMADGREAAVEGGGGGAAARDALLGRVGSDGVRARITELTRVDAYDWAMLFPRTEGMGAGGDVKRRVKMLKAIEPRLETLLYPDERIEFITSGVLNSFVEQYFLGVWALQINQTVFLFTNYRIILLNSDTKKRAKVMMWQAPYHRLRKYGAGQFAGSMRLKLSGGKSYAFSGVPGRDRKRLKEYMRARLEEVREANAEFPCHADRDPLCPTCCSPVPPKVYACPECNEEFIKPIKPALMSLVLPGLGDLYLGHTMLGIIELFGFIVVLFVALNIASSGEPIEILAGVGLIAVANLIDAAVTHHIASKGAMPKRLAWKGK